MTATAPASPTADLLATVARGLALDAATVATVGLLADHGIDSLLLKGPAVAHRLYPGDEGARPYGDVDLLLAPGTFAAAEQVLSDSGYRPIDGTAPTEWQSHEHAWRIPGPGSRTLDLHRSFAGVGDSDAFWLALRAGADQLLVAGSLVRVPAEPAAALLLGLHAARPASSTKPRRDLSRGLEILPEATWWAAAALARATQAVSAFAVGLRLVPAGADLAVRLDLPVSVTPVEWLGAHPVNATTLGLAKLAAAPTARARARLLRLRLLPPAGVLRLSSPLARRGRAGLVLAQVGRVARHAAAVPLGVVRLRAAFVAAGGAPAGRTGALRAGVWALRARRQVRRQLGRGPIDRVALPPAPPGGAGAERAVAAVLRRLGASCLEGALVRQHWSAGQCIERELVIGVTAPDAGFHAHAWLADETTAAHHGMVEIHRHRGPVAGRWTEHAVEPDTSGSGQVRRASVGVDRVRSFVRGRRWSRH